MCKWFKHLKAIGRLLLQKLRVNTFLYVYILIQIVCIDQRFMYQKHVIIKFSNIS